MSWKPVQLVAIGCSRDGAEKQAYLVRNVRRVTTSANVAKTQISRYARGFERQHYIRALYARHGAALKRKKSALMLAFAEYFDVDDDAIERGDMVKSCV